MAEDTCLEPVTHETIMDLRLKGMYLEAAELLVAYQKNKAENVKQTGVEYNKLQLLKRKMRGMCTRHSLSSSGKMTFACDKETRDGRAICDDCRIYRDLYRLGKQRQSCIDCGATLPTHKHKYCCECGKVRKDQSQKKYYLTKRKEMMKK